MADAQFEQNGVTLRLTKEEWWFATSAMGYVLYGRRLPDHDFRNILMMAPDHAERLLDALSEAESTARMTGNHWVPRLGPTYDV